jgi:hypothetical protein
MFGAGLVKRLGWLSLPSPSMNGRLRGNGANIVTR